MTRPRAAYLRHLILTLMGETTMPLEIRNECQNLMRAINANDLTEVVDRLAGLRRLAQAKGIQLPRPGTEPSQCD